MLAVAVAAAVMLAGCSGDDESAGIDEPVISAEDRAKLELVLAGTIRARGGTS